MRKDFAGFLEAVRAAPADDGPRLIFADWLADRGDPRAELIRTQIALAHLPDAHSRRLELLQTEHALLTVHAADWAGPFQGIASGMVFRRGFVEAVNVTARQFAAHAETLFRLAPVRHLTILDAGDHIGPVLGHPLLARLDALTVFAQHLGHLLAVSLARSPHLSGLKRLELGRNRLADHGVRVLTDAPCLDGLEHLDLRENDIGEAGGRALAAATRLGRLRHLELAGNRLGPTGAGAVCDATELSNLNHVGLAGNRIGPTRLLQLGPPRSLLRPASVNLSANGLTAEGLMAILAGADDLGVRHLDLGHNDLGDEGAWVVAGSRPAAGLRTLRMPANQIGDAGAVALAASPRLAGLTLLDLSNNPVGNAGLRAIVESSHLRSLRRFLYPDVGISFRTRSDLQARFMPIRQSHRQA